MQYKSLYSFYWFGTCLRYLQDANTAYKVHGDSFVLYNINRFFKNLEDFGLPVTSRLAHAKLDELIDELEKTDKEARLTNEQANKLNSAIALLRDTLEAEIKDVGAYTPTPKRLDLDKLLNNVASLLAPGVFAELPDIARYDFIEAGKCIAFELPTSAAFHIMRAIEDCLRHYYTHMVLSGRIKSENWAPIIKDLRKRNITKIRTTQ